MAKKIDLERNCPALRKLADQLADAITLLNELKADHNAQSAAITAKLNLEIARTEELATKYTAHLSATHPDTTNVLTEDPVTAISTTDNLVSSSSVEPL